MTLQRWQETLITSQADGSTLTAAAAASMIPTGALATLPTNFMEIGKSILVKASGRISCAVTTPGTARFDIRFGATVVWDSTAIPLNVVAKTTVGWYLEVLLTCRSIGSAATIWGQGMWFSEAALLVPVPSTGPGPGGNVLPYNTTPAVGGNTFNSAATQQVDVFFTQTVATGSLTCHQYCLQTLN